MFGFDIKEILQRKIVETLITLVIIHIGTVVFSFVVRWIHPHLKNYVAKDKRVRSNKLTKGSYESLSINKTESDEAVDYTDRLNSLDGQCLYLLDSLKSLVDVEESEITPEELEDAEFVDYTGSLNSLIIGIEETVNLRRILRQECKKNRCSSEAQTSISIHPKRELQYLLPKLILSQIPSDVSVVSSTPSEYESASSGASEYIDIDSRYLPFRPLGCSDNLKLHKVDDNSTSVTIESAEFSRKLKNISYTGSAISKKYGGQVGFENKILETAINEFEKELRPIKDQIRVLKECLNGFGSVSSSDVSSSITGTVGQTEGLSQVLSSTCSSDLCGSVSSPFSVTLEKPCDPEKTIKQSEPNLMVESLAALPILRSTDEVNFSETNCNKPQTIDMRRNVESKKSKKRSPLAEMYVKLSNCNSQPSNFTQNKSMHMAQFDESKAVTCRINLNLNLGTASFCSNQDMNCQKKIKILPLLSEPEDLLVKALISEKTLKPAKLMIDH